MLTQNPETAEIWRPPLAAFRLTRAQCLWLLLGLRPVVSGYRVALKVGWFPWDDFFRVHPELRPKGDKFHEDLMALAIALLQKLELWVTDNTTQSHRVSCSAMQISLLAFAARFAAKQVRHGHTNLPSGIPKVNHSSLLLKLERLRRTIARREKDCEPTIYREDQRRLHEFQAWMRNRAAYCRCNRSTHSITQRRQRMYVKECMKLATLIIQDERLPFPEEKKLRELVRLALRYARRSRLGATLKDFVCATSRGRYVLTVFLSSRLNLEA